MVDAGYQGRLTNVTALGAAPTPLNFAYAYKQDSDLLETTTYLVETGSHLDLGFKIDSGGWG